MMNSSFDVLRNICIVLLCFSLPACANTYHGAAIEGWVVDAGTRQPVKDVVVVAEWRLEGGIHTDVIGRLLLQETTTDEAGRYRFPAWGPLRAEKGRIDRSSPVLNFYKRGYKFQTLRNHGFAAPYIELPNPMISEWDGKPIELKPNRGGLDLDGYYAEKGECCYLYSVDEAKCAWQQMPHMTAELIKREREYAGKDVATSYPYRGNLMQGGKCPDPVQVLRDYLHE